MVAVMVEEGCGFHLVMKDTLAAAFCRASSTDKGWCTKVEGAAVEVAAVDPLFPLLLLLL